MEMHAKFEVKKFVDGNFYFVFFSRSGVYIMSGGYSKNRQKVFDKIELVRKSCQFDEQYELKIQDTGGYFFIINNELGEFIAVSDSHPDNLKARNAIGIVKREAPNALVIDMTKK